MGVKCNTVQPRTRWYVGLPQLVSKDGGPTFLVKNWEFRQAIAADANLLEGVERFPSCSVESWKQCYQHENVASRCHRSDFLLSNYNEAFVGTLWDGFQH